MVRGGRTRPTHTHKFVGVAILTASRGGVQLSPHRQPRARATSHRTALSLGQRQVRLGREKPVDHRSRAHAQPPTPPQSPHVGARPFARRDPAEGGSAQQLSWALNGRWVGTQLGSCCRRGCVRTANVCVWGGAVTSHLTLRLRRLRSHSAKRSLTARPLLARCRHESPMGSTETEQYAEAVS